MEYQYSAVVAKKSITIKEVAQEAGVSTQTVSRVLNDRPDVAPKTRHTVRAVIERLGYQPNAIARSLIRQRSHTMGVVASELDQYGPMRVLTGLEREAHNLGYSLILSLIHQPETDAGEQALNNLLGRQVDGIIWASAEIDHNRDWLREKIDRLPTPIVLLDGSFDANALVASSSRACGRLATQHLLAQGYRHIGHITGPLAYRSAQQRLLGWQDILLTTRPNQLVEGDWSAASGERGLRQLLAQYPELDAVYAANDQMALGVLQAAHQMSLRVPEDLGVVGTDNIPESAYFWPPLTTVRHHMIEQSKIIVRKLDQLIQAKAQNKQVDQPKNIYLQPELIIRKSS